MYSFADKRGGGGGGARPQNTEIAEKSCRTMLDINFIWFGFIACLSHWGGRGYFIKLFLPAYASRIGGRWVQTLSAPCRSCVEIMEEWKTPQKGNCIYFLYLFSIQPGSLI